MVKNFLLWLLFLFLPLQAANAEFLGARGESLTNAQEIANLLSAGDILIIGEVHGQAGAQYGQMQILQELQAQGKKFSVGFEFIAHTNQKHIDDFLDSKISKDEFLNLVGWGKGFSFDYYESQLLLPSQTHLGHSWAINAPREITSQVAKSGIGSLTIDQLSLLAPNLEKGNTLYFERFEKAAGAHLPSREALENYFWAQSIWDETMAWQILQRARPDEVFVVVVGEFHAQYGGGLPDRLIKRGAKKVWTISEIWSEGLNEQEITDEMAVHSRYGERANFFWKFL